MSERLSVYHTSLFSSDYTVRNGFVRYLKKKNFRVDCLLDYGAGNSPYQSLIVYQSYHTADVSGTERQPDFLLDPATPTIPQPDETYDFVLATDVLEHVSDLDKTLFEINRLLKVGGALLVKMPFMYREHERPYDYRRLTTFGLECALAKYGFEVNETLTIGNAFSCSYSLIRERFYEGRGGPSFFGRMISKFSDIFFLPFLNLTLFRVTHVGIYSSLVVLACKSGELSKR